MTIALSSFTKDLGITIRDALRADVTILAFNSTITAQNWIFLGRPKDFTDKFKVPRMIVEMIDRDQVEQTQADDKKISAPCIVHAWIDIASASALEEFDYIDSISRVCSALQNSDGITNSDIVAAGDINEPEETRTLKHITVRVNIQWRE